MCGPIDTALTGFRQGHIPPIRFDAATPVPIHRPQIRIGDDHLVAECLQALGHPLALRRGLHENAQARPTMAPYSMAGLLLRDLRSTPPASDPTRFLVRTGQNVLQSWPTRVISDRFAATISNFGRRTAH
jgi:hypothetical protein